MISVLDRISPDREPTLNGIYRGYAMGDKRIWSLFSHAPLSLDAALPGRTRATGLDPRVVEALVAYNRSAGAPHRSLEAAQALEDPTTLCVVTGQQAGFLGGPLYTPYKVATALRLARELQSMTGRRVVPVLWLATEDHDFQEVNHTWVLDRDARLARVSFPWSGSGRPIADLTVTPEVRRAYERYFALQDDTLGGAETARWFAPRDGEPYGTWVGRMYQSVFGERGLVVLEPRILAPAAGPYFRNVFRQLAGIREGLRRSAAALRDMGHTPPLDPDQAGVPFRFGADGMRTRCAPDADLAAEAAAAPTTFSADAALRPVLQDTLLPTAITVLGPGEIAYQSMLGPVYGCLDTPQPLVLARLSVTLLTQPEADIAQRAGLAMEDLLAPVFRSRSLLARKLDPETGRLLEGARNDLQVAMGGLSGRIGSLDPNLAITAQRTLDACLYALSRMEARIARATLSRQGVSARAVGNLRNAVRPRGEPQERTYPLPFLIHRHGVSILRALEALGDPLRPHHVVGVA